MALINCPECGKEISSLSSYCVNCGFPITDEVVSGQQIDAISLSDQNTSNEALDASKQPQENQLLVLLDAAKDKGKAVIESISESKAYTKITSWIGKVRTKFFEMINRIKASIRSLSPEKKSIIKKYVFASIPIVLIITTLLIVLTSTCAIVHHYTDANCTEPQTCKGCGETNGLPLGHEYVVSTKKAETCTDSGYIVYTCEHCESRRAEPIEPHPHTANAATCVEPSICQECNTQLEPAFDLYCRLNQ